MAKQRAFTVIELLTAGTIGIVVATVVGYGIVQGWRAFLNQQDQSELDRANRSTINQIETQARGATGVIPAVTIAGTLYQSDATDVVLHLTPIDSAGNFLTTGDDYLVFRLRPTTTDTVEEMLLPDPASARLNWPSPVTLNSLSTQFQVRYFTAGGTELIPGTDDLSASAQLTVTSQLGKTGALGNNSQTLSTNIFFRNKTT
ncbi:MAG TPA: hypothetical protein VLE93_02730 [Candidatus Saccharimonadales bacterium]|nr:hypothetical protein [Candidatus Saccharimonadales bacterium]